MAIFNETYINESLFKKKPKKEYHHLNKSEIQNCIAIVKKILPKYPKLKKAIYFINIYRESDYGNEAPIKTYFDGPGDDYLDIAEGDAWKAFPNLGENGIVDELWNMEYKLFDDCNKEFENASIKAKITKSEGLDCDDIGWALKSNKEK